MSVRLTHAETTVDLSDHEIGLLIEELRAQPDYAPGKPEWALAVILDQASGPDHDPALSVEFTGTETADLLDAIAQLDCRGDATVPLIVLRAAILNDIRRRGTLCLNPT